MVTNLQQNHSKKNSTPELEKGSTKRNGVKVNIDSYLNKTKAVWEYCRNFLREKRREIRHYAVVVAIVLFFVVLFQNFESSKFEFLFWSFSAPKIVLFFIMLIVGAIFGYWLRDRYISKKDDSKYSGFVNGYENFSSDRSSSHGRSKGLV
ncbi:MAG: hypothetical protein R3B45_05125 [Bdellovibrionota bacterium]